MRLDRGRAVAASLVQLLVSGLLWAKDPCDMKALGHQHRDVATIRRLEEAWNVAYLRGDTVFERCLLTPDFTEISRAGDVKVLADELQMAEVNQGKNLPIPETPKITILLHGNVAVAYGASVPAGQKSDQRPTKYADYYVWEHGRWHAFFAQQSQTAGN